MKMLKSHCMPPALAGLMQRIEPGAYAPAYAATRNIVLSMMRHKLRSGNRL
ncbi:MAG: hypothetical protein KGL40_03940 [Rhodocyclaceae bacterium]|nr:hypothetical protein [Rhodocyclaceae bacterium]